MPAKPAGVILAAGESSRMGFPKALLPYRGSTFLARLAALLDGKVEPLLLVLGHEAERIRAGARLPDSVRVLMNEGYRAGQLSSLQCAIRVLEGTDAPGLLVAPVDHPCVEESALNRLLEIFGAENPDVTVPKFEGRRGHPVIFSSRLFAELLAAPPDQGARAVVRSHAVREVPVDDPGILADIDDPEIYRRIIGEDWDADQR